MLNDFDDNLFRLDWVTAADKLILNLLISFPSLAYQIGKSGLLNCLSENKSSNNKAKFFMECIIAKNTYNGKAPYFQPCMVSSFP